MKKGIIGFLALIIILALIVMAGVSIFFFLFYYIPGTKCADKQKQEINLLSDKIISMVNYPIENTEFTIYGCVKQVKDNVINNQISELCFEFEKVMFLPKEEDICLKNVIFDLGLVGKLKAGKYEVSINKTGFIREVKFLKKIG
jgi:predicted membrane protein